MHPLSTELIIYIAISAVGLLTLVWAMLNGSVKLQQNPADMVAPPAAFNLPVIGASVFCCGVVGYIYGRYGGSSVGINALIAILAAIVGWIGMTMLMAKWAYNGPLVDPHEELEELQGTVAEVTKPITETELGEITYHFRGELVRNPAKSIDGQPVEVGTEVVIDMIQDGIADVELWSVVEQRI